MDQFGDIIDRIKKSRDVFEKAKLIKYLKDLDVRLTDIAKSVGIKPSYAAHYLRLNKLPDIIADGYYAKLVSATHLFIISRLRDEDQMIRVYEKVLTENRTAAGTEELVREEIYGTKTEGERLKPDEIAGMERILERALHEKIRFRVVQTRVKAKAIIELKGSMTETTEMLRKLHKLISR